MPLSASKAAGVVGALSPLLAGTCGAPPPDPPLFLLSSLMFFPSISSRLGFGCSGRAGGAAAAAILRRCFLL